MMKRVSPSDYAIVADQHEGIAALPAYDLPVFGCEGEAKSLRAQAAYLHKANDPALAAWVEGLIGNWC